MAELGGAAPVRPRRPRSRRPRRGHRAPGCSGTPAGAQDHASEGTCLPSPATPGQLDVDRGVTRAALSGESLEGGAPSLPPGPGRATRLPADCPATQDPHRAGRPAWSHPSELAASRPRGWGSTQVVTNDRKSTGRLVVSDHFTRHQEQPFSDQVDSCGWVADDAVSDATCRCASAISSRHSAPPARSATSGTPIHSRIGLRPARTGSAWPAATRAEHCAAYWFSLEWRCLPRPVESRQRRDAHTLVRRRTRRRWIVIL